MPGELSQQGASYALDYVSGRAVALAARTTYLAGLSAAPADTATTATALTNELAAAGYARQAVAWSPPAGDPSTTANTGTLTFGPFTADPPSMTHVALVSSSSGTGGDFLMWWALDVAKDAAVGESVQFAAAALVMALD